jgi:hypothetical protein
VATLPSLVRTILLESVGQMNLRQRAVQGVTDGIPWIGTGLLLVANGQIRLLKARRCSTRCECVSEMLRLSGPRNVAWTRAASSRARLFTCQLARPGPFGSPRRPTDGIYRMVRTERSATIRRGHHAETTATLVVRSDRSEHGRKCRARPDDTVEAVDHWLEGGHCRCAAYKRWAATSTVNTNGFSVGTSDILRDSNTRGVATRVSPTVTSIRVRDHIANFGGDPSKVMIFGQSGGGAKVSHLLAMPSARGLLHRAAIQSSGWPLRAVPRECATRAADQMLKQVGLTRKRASELQQVPVEMMLSAQASLAAQDVPADFAPVLDGSVIPRHPFDPDAPAVSADVSIIVSTTLDDASFAQTDFDLDEAGLRNAVTKIAPGRVDGIVTAYRRAFRPPVPFCRCARC